MYIWKTLYCFELYFTYYRVLDCQVFFFPLRILKIVLNCLLPFTLSNGKSAVIWILVLLYKLCFYFLLVDFLFITGFEQFVYYTPWLSLFLCLWFLHLQFSSNMGNLRPLFLQIFFCLLFSIFLLTTAIKCVFDCFNLFHKSQMMVILILKFYFLFLFHFR